MAMALATAQAALAALVELDTNSFAGQIIGHAFSDHMSKAAATAAAASQHRDKGYFEKITKTNINDVQDFTKLNDKYKKLVFPGYANKKTSQLGRFVNGKSFESTKSMDVSAMALLIMSAIRTGGGECRSGENSSNFSYFTVVPTGYVARGITVAGAKVGGGGINTRGLPWACLFIDGVGLAKVVSAFPCDDAYKASKPLLV